MTTSTDQKKLNMIASTDQKKLNMIASIGQKRMLQLLLSETTEARIRIWLDVLRTFVHHRGMVCHTPVHPAVDYGLKAVWWMLPANDQKWVLKSWSL